jgi:hypothetical protein
MADDIIGVLDLLNIRKLTFLVYPWFDDSTSNCWKISGSGNRSCVASGIYPDIATVEDYHEFDGDIAWFKEKDGKMG